MKSISKKQSKLIFDDSDLYFITEEERAMQRLRELKEQAFLRRAKRAQGQPPVGIYLLITITVFIALYLITQAL